MKEGRKDINEGMKAKQGRRSMKEGQKEGRKGGREEGEGHDYIGRTHGDDNSPPGVKSQGPEAHDYMTRKHGDDNSPPGVK